jgi:hypothetical protein
LGKGFAAVAWNSSTVFSPSDIVPKFAVGSASGAGFPHGMEVQIIGPTGSRQVMVRLVLAYFVGVANEALYSNEVYTIVALREY